MADLYDYAHATTWIVCGWFTDDYRPWAERLAANLSERRIPYDLVNVGSRRALWADITREKPCHLRQAMDKHADKTIIFLDVDCQVLADLEPLTQIAGHVGMYMVARRRGWSGSIRFRARSGTLVVKNTAQARDFVERWATIPAQYGNTDEDTLALALGSGGVAFEGLDRRWCVIAKDCTPDAAIWHDSAGKAAYKPSNTYKRLRRLGQTIARTWRLE